MEQSDYVYLMKPLVIPGLAFLILYPIILALVNILFKLPLLELKVLLGIYIVAALGIMALWSFGKSKRVRIEADKIIFRSILWNKVLLPGDIRRIIFYWTNKGQEIAQIRTANHAYYLTEFYFPFPELMADLEKFVRSHSIRSNLPEMYEGSRC